jgi:NADH-quinone oxidoreductase subunit M
MLYDRAHTRMIADFGGVAKVMPVFATIFMIVSLSSIGLPGLNGFVGEFLILLGTFRSTFMGTHAYAIVAASGVILAAVYLLWAYQRVIFGKVREGGLYGGHHLTDLNAKEVVSLAAILVFIVWIGVYPGTFLSKSAPVAKQLVQGLEFVRAGGQIRTAELPSNNLPSGR